MLEIRFHGRGGQGTVVASIVLAKALFKAGHFVQTFPLFGVERRGAPVEAFLRLSDKKILVRSNVYTPDHVVVQDPKLLATVDVTKGLKPGGWVLLNAHGLPDDLAPFEGFRLAWVDASEIAVKRRLGTRTHPIINTAMIGAFSRTFGMPPLSALEEAISEEIPVKIDQNIEAAKDAFEQTRLAGLIENGQVRAA